MDRRDAFKALGTLVAGAGLTVTPVATKDVDELQMVIFRTDGKLSQEGAAHLIRYWKQACEGTSLDGVKTIVLSDGIDVEFVRR